MTVYYELSDDSGRVCRIMTRQELKKEAGLKNDGAINTFLRDLTVNNNAKYKGYYISKRTDSVQKDIFYMEKVDESERSIWYVTRDGKIVRVDKRSNRQHVQKSQKEGGGYIVKIHGRRLSLARIMYQKFVGKPIPKGTRLHFEGEPKLENLRVGIENKRSSKKCALVKDGKIVQTFDSIKEAAERCYVSESTALKTIHGKINNPMVNLVLI